jgi:hypothetical protein
MFCLAFYFCLCLRGRYFKEYQEGADNVDVYSFLVRLNRDHPFHDIAGDGTYVSPLNFYLEADKHPFPPLEYVSGEGPKGKAIYVIHKSYDRTLIERLRLQIIYYGPSTSVVVAVPSDEGVSGISRIDAGRVRRELTISPPRLPTVISTTRLSSASRVMRVE